jgi:predicted alpha/beta superfamily hydrolase
MFARRPVLLTASLLLSALSVSRAGAQKLIQTPKTEIFTLASKAVGDSFEIRVMLPPTIPGETTRFPVVYMTDVHEGFIIGEDEMRLMMLGDVPRFIAVGIGNASAANIMEALLIRARDLTHVQFTAEVGGSFPIANMVKPSVGTGGAAKFLSFIRDELMPVINKRYPTDPKDNCYWGDSLGGLFGTYVLFTQPDTFNRYIIGSPSLWWSKEDVMGVAEKYLASHNDIQAKIFLGVGGLEEGGPGSDFRMVTNTLKLERMIRAKNMPGVSLTAHVFPDETHTTVAPMNLIRGLVAVFGPPTPDQSLMAKYAAEAKKN